MANPRQTLNFTDLDLNFLVHPIKGDIAELTGSAAVVRAIRNLVLTNHYESPFHPEIGSSVKKQLFEPNNGLTASFIRRSIQDVIKNFEPRVDPTSLQVDVVWRPTDRAFQVNMFFFIINQASPITTSFLLRRVR